MIKICLVDKIEFSGNGIFEYWEVSIKKCKKYLSEIRGDDIESCVRSSEVCKIMSRDLGLYVIPSDKPLRYHSMVYMVYYKKDIQKYFIIKYAQRLWQ